MRGEVRAVLKVEFVLAALLRRARRHIAERCSVAKDCGAELLVHKNSSPVFRHTAGDSGLESLVNHLLGLSDLTGLIFRQRCLPAKQLRLKGFPMVEGKKIKRLGKTGTHKTPPWAIRNSSFFATHSVEISNVYLIIRPFPKTGRRGRLRGSLD